MVMIGEDSRPQIPVHFLLQEKIYAVDTVGYRNSDFYYHWADDAINELATLAREYKFSQPSTILQYPLLPVKKFSSGFNIGVTPLIPLSGMGDRIDIKLWAKCEHHNPSGSFKDRETLIAHLASREKNYRTSIGFSSGNACCSAAYVASRAGQRFIAVVSGDIYPEKLKYMTDKGIDVVTVGQNSCHFERGYQVFLRAKRQLEFELNGIDDWSVSSPFRVEGDKSIALEIIHQLGKPINGVYNVPDFVVLPTANGSGLSGIWKGFKELFALKVISKLPRMVSIGIEHTSPIFNLRNNKSIEGKVTCDLQFLNPDNASIGSTLIVEESYDLFNGYQAIRESNGLAFEGNAEDIRTEYRNLLSIELDSLLKYDLMPEPCSMLPLTAVRKMKDKGLLTSGNSVVLIFTGHAKKSTMLLEEFGTNIPHYDTWLKKANAQPVNDEIIPAKKGKIYSASEQPGDLENVLIQLL